MKSKTLPNKDDFILKEKNWWKIRIQHCWWGFWILTDEGYVSSPLNWAFFLGVSVVEGATNYYIIINILFLFVYFQQIQRFSSIAPWEHAALYPPFFGCYKFLLLGLPYLLSLSSWHVPLLILSFISIFQRET